jgi:hypothetical protein
MSKMQSITNRRRLTALFAYDDYFAMGSPATRRRDPARQLAEKNGGRPLSTTGVRAAAGEPFARDFPPRENDVCLITLTR